jgi:hypothetical protein
MNLEAIAVCTFVEATTEGVAHAVLRLAHLDEGHNLFHSPELTIQLGGVNMEGYAKLEPNKLYTVAIAPHDVPIEDEPEAEAEVPVDADSV